MTAVFALPSDFHRKLVDDPPTYPPPQTQRHVNPLTVQEV